MPYHVIEFKELPYADIEKYVCVPASWIKWQDVSKGTVIVAYPVEEPSCTLQRVVNDAKYSRDWKCFLAKEEYNTSGYNEAINFIKYLNNKRNRETEDSSKKQQDKKKTSSSNTYVPGEFKTADNNSTDDNTYVPSDFETDGSDFNDDYASSDDSEEAVPRPKHKPGRPSERNRGKAKIILPPEYDPDFPRWSLKYPELSYRDRMDLIEIRPGGRKSGIFVKRRGFEKCFEISDTDNTLARNLLKEIFTKNALRVCTLTGKVPAGFEGDQSDIRPGLYVHGVNALVETVLKHGYRESEESIIRSCLSAKLYHLRKTL